MLSVFDAAIPVGGALGFIVGGEVAKTYGWRSAFFVAGAPGLALALGSLLLPEPTRGAQDDDSRRRPSPWSSRSKRCWATSST